VRYGRAMSAELTIAGAALEAIGLAIVFVERR
jgi:hypothetical protein